MLKQNYKILKKNLRMLRRMISLSLKKDLLDPREEIPMKIRAHKKRRKK